MRQNTYIRNLFALAVLLVFTLSITPTKVLHFFFANHQDENIPQPLIDKNKVTVSIAAYHCQVSDLVVIAPYTTHYQGVGYEFSEIYPDHKAADPATFHFHYHFFFDLRGPPSLPGVTC